MIGASSSVKRMPMRLMRYLIAVALPLLALGLLPTESLSAQQAGEIVGIRGRVFYANGEVAPRALVTAIPLKEGPLDSRVPTGTSDNEGRFFIGRLESGVAYDLCASKQAQGYLDPWLLAFGLPTGGQCKKITAGIASEVDVVLAPKAGTLEGEVRAARNRNRISNGKVIVYRPLKLLGQTWELVNPREATWVPSVEAPVGGSGQFEISGLPTGTYFLKVEIQGRKPWYFNSQVSDTAAQAIAIQSGLTRKIVLRIP
jgi:hypothetical protein